MRTITQCLRFEHARKAYAEAVKTANPLHVSRVVLYVYQDKHPPYQIECFFIVVEPKNYGTKRDKERFEHVFSDVMEEILSTKLSEPTSDVELAFNKAARQLKLL